MKHQVNVHPVVDGLAAYSWRLLVIAAALGGSLWLAGQIWVVFVPLIVALFLARILSPPTAWLRSRGAPPALAAAAALVSFLFVLGAAFGAIGVAVANEFADLGPTVSEAVDDVERWLVDDSPLELDQAKVDRFRREGSKAIGESLRT